MLLGMGIVNASDDRYFKVVDEASLEECLKKEITCRLQDNLTISSAKEITKETILDLNGHNIIASKDLNLKSGMLIVETTFLNI